jgi:hypothetical protein
MITVSKNHAKIIDYAEKIEKIIYLLNPNKLLHLL